MPNYPAYIQQILAEARDLGQYYAGQPDAAALCYDVLALFPDHREANNLIYNLFCDEWLIYDNRVAVQQDIDEWDDRPWQQRRRLALSFRVMSRWEGWTREYEDGHEVEREGPQDVKTLLDEGKSQLLAAYCLGDEECTDYAWPRFAEAIQHTGDPFHALLWVGKLYADLGFFADATEILIELCSRFQDADARRLLVEVRWWRDNAHRLPWVPPPGDGSRYRRMIKFIDPAAPTDEEIRQYRRERKTEDDVPTWKPVIDSELAALFAAALPEENAPAPAKSLVDWSFLDHDDGAPGELPAWVKKQMRLFPRQAGEIAKIHRLTRPIPAPITPVRRNPNDAPFDPSEFLDIDESDDEDLSDLDDLGFDDEEE